jgi:predicted AAA+ superfamily ATPase
MVIDEIQYAPELFSYIKIRIDEQRSKTGQFILTGSQSFNLMKGVSESLAGRVAVLTLLPFSWNELALRDATDPKSLAEEIILGFYPEPRVKKKLNLDIWYNSYIQTYLERDVRNMQSIKDLHLFQRFIALLAGRVGSVLNVSELSRDTGISQGAAIQWLSILEASRLIFRLPPYYKNKGKRLVKSSKVYFEDTGLLCHLIQETSVATLLLKPLMGHLFENLVISDLRKHYYQKGKTPHFYFYRTSSGNEVDLVIEDKGRVIPIEIKLSKTFHPQEIKSLVKFCDLYKTRGLWVTLYPDELKVHRMITAVNFPVKKL